MIQNCTFNRRSVFVNVVWAALLVVALAPRANAQIMVGIVLAPWRSIATRVPTAESAINVAACLAERPDLVVERPPIAGEHVGAGYYDVYLPGPRLDRGVYLVQLLLERDLPRREAG